MCSALPAAPFAFGLRASAAVLLCALSSGVHAETYTVSSLQDSGPGSLREAVERANTNPGIDTIRFGLDGTIELASPLVVRDDLRMDGMGRKVQISGGGKVSLVLLAETQKTLELSRLTFTRGHSNASTGGAIQARGRLMVSESLFTDNVAPVGGAIYSSGDALEVVNTSFSGNQALAWGGAIAVSPVTVATVTHSTFVNNTAAQFGGALFQNPIYADTSKSAGGMLPTSTVATAVPSAAVGAIHVRNSILSGVSAQGNCSLISNRILDGGGNLSSDASCPFSAARSSMSGLNPMLSPLADHGGPTRSFMPLPGSPAVDAGIDLLAISPSGSGLSHDQRGERRSVGLRVDRGAVELQSSDRVAVAPAGPAAGQVSARLQEGLPAGDASATAAPVATPAAAAATTAAATPATTVAIAADAAAPGTEASSAKTAGKVSGKEARKRSKSRKSDAAKAQESAKSVEPVVATSTTSVKDKPTQLAQRRSSAP